MLIRLLSAVADHVLQACTLLLRRSLLCSCGLCGTTLWRVSTLESWQWPSLFGCGELPAPRLLPQPGLPRLLLAPATGCSSCCEDMLRAVGFQAALPTAVCSPCHHLSMQL